MRQMQRRIEENTGENKNQGDTSNGVSEERDRRRTRTRDIGERENRRKRQKKNKDQGDKIRKEKKLLLG